MRLWLGIVTFLAGAALWQITGRQRGAHPAWVPRLALGLAALGLATLATTQPGLPWSISAICFGLIAVVLIGWALWDNLRR